MTTVIHRKDESLSREQVMEKLNTELTKRETQYGGIDAIKALADTYAKTYTDNFIVADRDELQYTISQGDIVIHHESSDYFKEVIESVMDRRPAKDMNLQEGVSITGDHRIIPMEGASITIEDARFVPKDNVMGRRAYECKIVTSDKPFLIAHREHGNITLLDGIYLVFSQIDAKTMRRVYD